MSHVSFTLIFLFEDGHFLNEAAVCFPRHVCKKQLLVILWWNAGLRDNVQNSMPYIYWKCVVINSALHHVSYCTYFLYCLYCHGEIETHLWTKYNSYVVVVFPAICKIVHSSCDLVKVVALFGCDCGKHQRVQSPSYRHCWLGFLFKAGTLITWCDQLISMLVKCDTATIRAKFC
jgi:hypothetical protein